MKKEDISYPILFDCGGRMCKELGLRGYPTAFLVDKNDKVLWEGTLHKRNHGVVEAHIKRLSTR